MEQVKTIVLNTTALYVYTQRVNRIFSRVRFYFTYMNTIINKPVEYALTWGIIR